MIVRIDPAGVRLDEPDECGRFHVQVAEGVTDLAGALAAADVGTLADDEHAWVRVDAVRRLAEGRVPDDWPSRFDGMLRYAASKGWLDGEGSAIRAHLEHDDGEGSVTSGRP